MYNKKFKPYDKIIIFDPIDGFYKLDWFSRYINENTIETILGRILDSEPTMYTQELWENEIKELNNSRQSLTDSINEHIERVYTIKVEQDESKANEITQQADSEILKMILEQIKEINRKIYEPYYIPMIPQNPPYEPLQPYYNKDKYKYDPDQFKIYCSNNTTTTWEDISDTKCNKPYHIKNEPKTKY